VAVNGDARRVGTTSLTPATLDARRAALLSSTGFQLLDHLAGLRKSIDLVFGEDRLAVDDNVEDAVLAADQLGLDSELLGNLCRQTGGSGPVVSGRAVADLDLHDVAPFDAG